MKSTEFTNWLSFTHDEYIAAMQMGKFNYDSMQLAAKWWTLYLERKYLEGQQHIVYFMAAMFRLTDKYVLRGGIGHMAKKGNEDALALLQTASKIEKVSFKNISQPNITFIEPKNIRPGSWENQFELLAVNMMLHPDEHKGGFDVNSEKSYSSPLALTALKIYIRTLETAISYEIKRKVITPMEKTQDSIETYQKEFDKRTKESFLSIAQNVDQSETKLEQLIDHAKSFLEKVDMIIEEIDQKLNLKIANQLAKSEKRLAKLTAVVDEIEKVTEKLLNKKIFRGFFVRRLLRKLIKTGEG